MGYELWAKDVCDLALAQVGKPCGKTNEYSAELDSVKFYNYPKNGVADSCSIFVDDMVYRSIKPQTADNARNALCEPNKDNCGAGCTQSAQYFKDAKRWYPKMSDAHCGDKMFLKKSNGALYHTGVVVDWDDKGIYTVEGNTNGGTVAKKFYAYGDSKVAGFGRPKYNGYEKPKEEPVEDVKPEPVPEPIPVPEPKPIKKTIDELAKEVIDGKWGNGKARADKLTAAGYDYQAVQDRVNEILGVGKSSGQPYKVVNVNSFLRIRSAPSLEGQIIGRLNNGDKVTVYKTSGNWAKISKDSERWCSMDYLTKA